MFIIGKTTPERERLVQVAKECMEIGAEACKPYTFVGDSAAAVTKHAHKNGYTVVRDLCGLGSLEMLRPNCVKVRADNSACVHAYYVRVDADKADRFAFAERKADGGCVRGVTAPLSVPDMHQLAEQVRKESGSIFFAAMSE